MFQREGKKADILKGGRVLLVAESSIAEPWRV